MDSPATTLSHNLGDPRCPSGAEEDAIVLAMDIQRAYDDAGGGPKVEVDCYYWGTRDERWRVMVEGKKVESVCEAMKLIERN